MRHHGKYDAFQARFGCIKSCLRCLEDRVRYGRHDAFLLFVILIHGRPSAFCQLSLTSFDAKLHADERVSHSKIVVARIVGGVAAASL